MTFLGCALEAGVELTIMRTTFTNTSTTENVPDANKETPLAGGGAVLSRGSAFGE
jgi:hypothetical protein